MPSECGGAGEIEAGAVEDDSFAFSVTPAGIRLATQRGAETYLTYSSSLTRVSSANGLARLRTLQD